MAKVDKSALHDFVNAETVTDSMLDQNFEVLRTAQNDTDDKVNNTYTKAQADTTKADLAGAGRTTETIKGNADALAAHKTSGDHDGRYYQKSETYSAVEVDSHLQSKIDAVNAYSKTEVDNKFNNYIASWQPQQLGKMYQLYQSISLASSSSTVTLNIPEYNPATDFVMISQNGMEIKKDRDYTISSDGVTLTKVSGQWQLPTTLDITVLKALDTDAVYQDGRMLQDGSVSEAKFDQAFNDKIGNLSVFYTPQMYGAKGDNTTDDTAAIQAAIDAAKNAGGGLVIIPRGTYKITGTINLPNNGVQVVIQGAGMRHTKINYTGTGTAINAIGTTGSRIYFYLRDISLYNITSGIYGVEMEWSAVHSGMRNVQIEGFLTAQLRINNTWQCLFESCLFNGTSYNSGSLPTSQNGVKIGSNTTTLRFFDCTMDNSEYGVYALGGNGHQFISCVSQNSNTAGFYLTNDVANGGGIHTIAYCYFEKGVAASTSWAIKIVGTATYAIATCLVENCTFNDSPNNLYLSYAPQTTVIGNNFNSSATRTVEIHTGSNRCTFLSNNNGVGIYNPDGVIIDAIEMDKMVYGSSTGTQMIPGVDINMNLKNIYNIGKGQVTNFLIMNTGVTASTVDNGSLFKDSADGKLKYKDASGVVNLLY